MDKHPASFLIQCDRQLNIVKEFWSHPVYLLSPYHKKLSDLFMPSDGGKVVSVAEQALLQNEVLTCEGSFAMVTPAQLNLSLCMVSVDENVLVHGLATEVMEQEPFGMVFKDMVKRFMSAIRIPDKNFIAGNGNMVRDQFEQIQKLNNDLVNMQRQVKKANSKLNQLNQDLNNRLVKDALTGLVSRYQYRAEIDYTITNAPEKLGIFTFIDIDGFKGINDNYGHRAGDHFLKVFAERLLKLPFENYICMRIAGDEFGLYMHGHEKVEDEDVRLIWESIEKVVLKEPIEIGGLKKEIQCSAGMAVFGKDTKDVYDLIEYADYAMYEAKKSGKNRYRRFNFDRYQDKNISVL